MKRRAVATMRRPPDKDERRPPQPPFKESVADQDDQGSLASSFAHAADIAAVYAARGWHVFPVSPNVKQPAISDWPNLACADPKKVRAAWPVDHNIGISCGPSGLVVIDLDTTAGRALPPPWDIEIGVKDGLDVWAVLRERHDPDWRNWLSTHTVMTPSGGLHLYFRNPENATTSGQWRNTASRLGPMIDTRGAGGFVLAAGSVVDGKTYEILDDAEPACVPGWLAILLSNGKDALTRPPANALRAPDKYVAAAFKNEITAVASAWEGARNHQLNKSAFALARFVAAGQLDRDVVVGALTLAADQCGLIPSETAATIRSALVARGIRV
jgi:hypothetical protein